jgi:type IX secretion system PorP/SprF family membrane protein
LQKADFRDKVPDPVQAFDYSQTFPNFGVGVYWYSDNYYVGISVPDFFFPSEGSEAFDVNPQNYNYTFLGGYLFRISDEIKFRPSTMLAYSLGAPVSYQVNLSVVTFQDRIFAGVGYKSKGLVFMLEFQPTSTIRIGYAVEAPTGGVKALAPHWSHEILIRYDFTYELRTVSPAYFY